MKKYLKLNLHELEYKISYCQRKSVGIRLDEEGMVFVRAPKGITQKQVEEILYKKINWIIKNREALEKLKTEQTDRKYTTGTLLYYRGKECFLRIISVEKRKDENVILRDNGEIHVFTINEEKEYIKGLLEQWYRREAKKVIAEKAKCYIKHYNAEYCNIRIKAMKTRWGSCSSKKNLNFNWKIMMAPEEVIDYLVVHELSHLVEMNHSGRFYRQIEKVLPNYKVSRQWLKSNGNSLEL